MKTLYLDCGMGAAGDMLTAALLELMPDREKAVEMLNATGIPDVRYTAEPSVKCGILGTHMKVEVAGVEEAAGDDDHEHDHDHDHEQEHNHEHDHDHDHEHEHVHDHDHDHDHEHHHHHDHDHSGGHVHHGMHDIEHIVRDHLDIPENVRQDILNVFFMIAEAESHVHGVPVSEIHFHEVGTMDAVADVAAVCLLMNALKPDEILASPVRVGYGTVKCAHGILPVPAPATAYILQGVPAYAGEIRGEMCTPTGAALLKYFVKRFVPMPAMQTDSIGYGMGRKDFPAANCVRAMLGRTEGKTEGKTDAVTELSCNIDDMTAEAIAYAAEKIMEGGAKDVYTLSAGMKKGRPGTVLNVLCAPDDEERIASLIFRHTTTLGIRKSRMDRYVLDRRIETVETPYGPVRKKISEGYGTRTEKYEYDDLSRIAKEQNKSIRQILEEIDREAR